MSTRPIYRSYGPDDAQPQPGEGGGGRVVSVSFTPSFGSILIPVVAGVQTFAGSKAPVQSTVIGGGPNDDPQPWDISLQVQGNNNNNNIAVYWQLQWWVKGAAYASPIKALDLGSVGASALRYYNAGANGQRVIASRADVSIWAVTNQPPGTIKDLPVSVGIAPCGFCDAQDEYSWIWGTPVVGLSGNVLDKPGNAFLQGGCVGQFACTLKTAGAGVVYPMLLDLADVSGIVSGVTPPIKGTVLAGLSTAGQQAGYGDEFRPGTVNFNQGLVFSLSTTPDVCTTPVAGAVGVSSVKVGQ
jgi:hypothetical protein